MAVSDAYAGDTAANPARLFEKLHPYMDGNGRMARFTMNLFLASGGYPWTVIRVDDRERYMAALETASVGDDPTAFARFVAEQIS